EQAAVLNAIGAPGTGAGGNAQGGRFIRDRSQWRESRAGRDIEVGGEVVPVVAEAVRSAGRFAVDTVVPAEVDSDNLVGAWRDWSGGLAFNDFENAEIGKVAFLDGRLEPDVSV